MALAMGTAVPAHAIVFHNDGASAAFSVGDVPGSGSGNGGPVVALTFDDGPNPVYTPQVLSILSRYQAPATFFEIGKEIAAAPALTASVAAAGDAVENHTWDHPSLVNVPASGWPGEVDRTSALIQQITGKAPTCLRPPYGAVNSSVLDLAAQRHLTAVLWSADTRDWTTPGVPAIVSNALIGLHNGSIILMHDGGGNRSQTVAALPIIIQTLRARGYTIVPLCGGTTFVPHVPQLFNFGTAQPLAQTVTSTAPVVASAPTADGGGAWSVGSDGSVYTFGDAVNYGSMAGQALADPVVGMAATPDGRGYWMVASDGGIFTFGDAAFYGSMGGHPLNKPVVGMAATPMAGLLDGGVGWRHFHLW